MIWQELTYHCYVFCMLAELGTEAVLVMGFYLSVLAGCMYNEERSDWFWVRESDVARLD